ncbi:hypothetical protein MUP01_00965 [Candidatus Bathyarchaeota archaeon]|nr:hypothetical protein [Candidatus Bathyarchaeota archaeon]
MSGNDTALISDLENDVDYTWFGNQTILNVTAHVLGDNKTIQYERAVYNATTIQNSTTFLVNVENGSISPNTDYFIWFFVASNLQLGDPVFLPPSSYSGYKINETILTDYSGSFDLTNHLNHMDNSTSSVSGVDYVTINTIDVYWDKTSGILLLFKGSFNTSRTDSLNNLLVTHVTVEIRLTSASPAIPEFHSFLTLTTFMIAIPLVVIVCRRRRLL